MQWINDTSKIFYTTRYDKIKIKLGTHREKWLYVTSMNSQIIIFIALLEK